MTDAIGRLNEPPLSVRLDEAFRRDGMPLTTHERTVLRELREARNAITHGRERSLPSHEDLVLGVAIVCRAIVHRLHRLAANA